MNYYWIWNKNDEKEKKIQSVQNKDISDVVHLLNLHVPGSIFVSFQSQW